MGQQQAADLAQDTFLRILGSRQDKLPGLREPRAYLTICTAPGARRAARKSARYDF